MKDLKKYFILLIFLIVLLSGCTSQDCQTRCNNIKESENVPHFDKQMILPGGCYYGSLNQKALGTPAGWVHYDEGSQRASWCPFNPDFIDDCDC